MSINLIVAKTNSNVIGDSINNNIPWKLSTDLKYFKQITTNNIVIMGRNTHDSIGKALPNRENIIISSDKYLKTPGCINASSLVEALEIATEIAELFNKEIFIIGGASIYKQCISLVEAMYITEIHCNYQGNVFFPKYDTNEWTETSRIENIENDVKFDFVVYERKATE